MFEQAVSRNQRFLLNITAPKQKRGGFGVGKREIDMLSPNSKKDGGDIIDAEFEAKDR